jgi:hypothetical protein
MCSLGLLSNRSTWLLVAVTVAAGCAGADSGGSGNTGAGNSRPVGPSQTAPRSAQRVIAEADIIQLDVGRLYALSKSGTASIVDVSTPGTLTLLGQTTVRGTPFEMYRRGDYLVVMSNGAIAADGTQTNVATPAPADAGGGALVTVLDVRDPAAIVEAATLGVPGEIADSRVVGSILYLVTYENALCYQCGSVPRTIVTTFEVRRPTSLSLVEQVVFENDGANNTGLAAWKRSIFATTERLYVGGQGAIDPYSYNTTVSEGTIDVIDISDRRGRMKIGSRVSVAGPITSRWQMEERNGVLRVVSQRGIGRTTNGIGSPEVETFRVDSVTSVVPLGRLAMRLPRQESLRAVRFDDARAYAITYFQGDPLFVIDLADPAAPVQRGELVMPGFMYHLEPRGDRIIGLGLDRLDSNGSLNVSLFDVADADHPKMLSRVAFSVPYVNEDYAILNGLVAEDQDRIQKAFRVFQNGVVVVPFTSPTPYYATSSLCDNPGGGVQLMEWSGDTLTKRALLPLPGNPRRAFENGGELVTVSDSNVRAFSMENMAVAHQTADLMIGTCVPDASPYFGPGGGGFVDGGGWEGQQACAAVPGQASGNAIIVVALGLLIAGRRSRRS